MRHWVAAGLALAIAALSLPIAAQVSGAGPCKAGDFKCAQEAMQKHPIRSPAYWEAWRNRPLDERIAIGPPEMVEFLKLDVLANQIPLSPSAPAADDEMLGELRQAVKELPANIRSMLDRRLLGLFLVNDFGGTGISDAVRWSKREGAGFIVLDPKVLRQRVANDWAAWKENSPFRDDGNWRIEAIIADKGDNLRQRAVQYILLHEIAHVLATRDTVHPRWDGIPAPVPAGRFPFFDLSWRWDVALKNHATRFDHAWMDRRKVRYYFGAQLGGADMEPAYRWLETTNFPSLYAATNPGDDFAESFVTYVHSVLMKRPWAIRIINGDRVVRQVASCWDQPRCAEKRKVLEAMLDEFARDSATSTPE